MAYCIYIGKKIFPENVEVQFFESYLEGLFLLQMHRNRLANPEGLAKAFGLDLSQKESCKFLKRRLNESRVFINKNAWLEQIDSDSMRVDSKKNVNDFVTVPLENGGNIVIKKLEEKKENTSVRRQRRTMRIYEGCQSGSRTSRSKRRLRMQNDVEKGNKNKAKAPGYYVDKIIKPKSDSVVIGKPTVHVAETDVVFSHPASFEKGGFFYDLFQYELNRLKADFVSDQKIPAEYTNFYWCALEEAQWILSNEMSSETLGSHARKVSYKKLLKAMRRLDRSDMPYEEVMLADSLVIFLLAKYKVFCAEWYEAVKAQQKKAFVVQMRKIRGKRNQEFAEKREAEKEEASKKSEKLPEEMLSQILSEKYKRSKQISRFNREKVARVRSQTQEKVDRKKPSPQMFSDASFVDVNGPFFERFVEMKQRLWENLDGDVDYFDILKRSKKIVERMSQTGHVIKSPKRKTYYLRILRKLNAFDHVDSFEDLSAQEMMDFKRLITSVHVMHEELNDLLYKLEKALVKERNKKTAQLQKVALLLREEHFVNTNAVSFLQKGDRSRKGVRSFRKKA